MIDGALQTIAALAGDAELMTPHLPFALDEVDIVHQAPQTCYAYAECADSHTRNHAGVRKFNIRILNERGDVLIAFKNLYVRPLDKPLTSSQSLVAAGLAANGRLLSPAG
jgi:polyketide synthase PksN